MGVGQDLSLLRQYIPFILHDRMVFSAMVAMASLGADIAANGNRERSSETLKYYQLAVSLLRQRLMDESQRSNDAVVVTLSNLCGFEVSLSLPSYGQTRHINLEFPGNVRKIRCSRYAYPGYQTCCLSQGWPRQTR